MNRFKPSALTIALAGVFGACAFAPAAHAVNVVRSAAAVTAGNVLYTSGATAPTKTVWKAFRQFCKIDVSAGDTFDVYKAGTAANLFDPGDTGFGNSFTYTCKFKSAGDPAPVPVAFQGQDVVYMAGVTDGSFSSIRGFTTDTTQQQAFVVATFANCGLTTGLNSDGDLTSGGCSTERKRSMGGFSDVEGAMFQDLLPTPGGVTTADFTATPVLAGQVFGLAASEALYRALQVAQGLPADCQNDGAFTAPVIVGLDDRSPACQPSISTTQYSSLINNIKTALPKVVGWGFMGVPADPVAVVCRRVDVSGTQASNNAYFLNRPCGRGPQTLGQRVAGGLGTVGNAALGTKVYIATNSGSSNVRTCLNNGALPNVGAVAASNLRIGVLSAENQPDPTDAFAYIKLNGTAVNEDAQNRASTIDGRYDFAYELVLHTSPDTAVTPTAQKDVLVQLAGDLGNPTITDLRGLYQVRSAAFPQTSNPTKIAKGTRGNNSCAPFTF